MEIRLATKRDKAGVISMCNMIYPNADYVQDTWDTWIKEGVFTCCARIKPAWECAISRYVQDKCGWRGCGSIRISESAAMAPP